MCRRYKDSQKCWNHVNSSPQLPWRAFLGGVCIFIRSSWPEFWWKGSSKLPLCVWVSLVCVLALQSTAQPARVRPSDPKDAGMSTDRWMWMSDIIKCLISYVHFHESTLCKQLLWILNRSDLKPQPEDEFEGWKERSGEGKSLHFTPFSGIFQYNI